MSSIDNAKRTMGWVPQNARPRCGNCARVEVNDSLRYSRPELRCTRGGFYTQPSAICNQHEPMALAGGANA